jgi:pimeloyl-ACP methyl ester carboxylesterase
MPQPRCRTNSPLSLKALTALILSILFLSPLQAEQASNNEKLELTDTSKLSYDARLTGLDYGYPVEVFEIASQGQTLAMAYGYMKGEEDKPTITLLHGKNFNGAYWLQTATYLNSQGYSVLIPDQIGFGKSSKPETYQYSFAVLADHTVKLLKHLSIKKTIIIGHSMGGMLATRFALQHPDMTEQLILLNPIGLENYLRYVEYKDTDFFYKAELKKTPEGIRAYQQKNYYDGAWTAKYDSLTHFMIGQLQGPDKKKIAWINALTYDMIFTQPVVTELKNIFVPTTLIIGTRDRTGPGRNWKRSNVSHQLGLYDQLGDEAARQIPNAKLIKLKAIGHLPHIEDFTAFKKVLNTALKP